MPLDKETLAHCLRSLGDIQHKDNPLNKQELKLLLQEILGASATEDIIYSLMAEIEEDCTGQIEFAEILRVFERQAAEGYDEDDTQNMTAVWVALGGSATALDEPIPFENLLNAFRDNYSIDVDKDTLRRALGVGGDNKLRYQAFTAYYK